MVQNITRLIAIAGYPGSGKDTIATHLMQYGYKRETWKAKICEALSTIYGLSIEKLMGHTAEDRVWRETPNSELGWKTPLEALRFLGEGMREFDEDIWVRATLKTVGSDLTVISDTRKFNEAEAVIRQGGELWYVQRPGCFSNEPCDRQVNSLKYTASHVFENRKDIPYLLQQVNSALQIEHLSAPV